MEPVKNKSIQRSNYNLVKNQSIHRPNYNPDVQPKPKLSGNQYVGDLFELSDKALNYYNSIHTSDFFVMVDPLALNKFRTTHWRDGVLHHVSFIACSCVYSHLKLFFAEFALNGKEIQICTTVEPGNPLVQSRCAACQYDGIIFHPLYDSRFGSFLGGGGVMIEHKYAEKFFRDVYEITTAVEELDSCDSYELKKTYEKHAVYALKKFNIENDTSYELKEVVSCNRFAAKAVSNMPYWAHLTFTAAKVEDGDSIENSPVLFFAEDGFAKKNYHVQTCVIISTADDFAVSLSEEESECAACRGLCPMFHPEGEYTAGYEGGSFADSLYKGHFRAVKSRLLMKEDAVSKAAREERLRYFWSGDRKSQQSSQEN